MDKALINRITINSEICHGKPVIRGLRYPVETMLELLASGMSTDEILEDYPDLEKEDLLACLSYAAKLTQIKSIYKNCLVKFIVDAQLPISVSTLLNSKGFDSTHTLELSDKNCTSDKQILELALKEKRVVITKDNDFLESYLVKKEPEKLIVVRTGNIKNAELLSIFDNNIEHIVELLKNNSLVEIDKTTIIVHS